MFYLMYGTFMIIITPELADRIDQKGRLVVNMTSKFVQFWDHNVWEEWKEQFPNPADWTDNDPKDHVIVKIVQQSNE